MGDAGGVEAREFAGATATVASARAMVDDWLDRQRAPDELRERAALVVSELASNAVQASPQRPYEVRVGPDAAPGSVVIAVMNAAPVAAIPDRDDWGPDSPLAHRGRGLAIVDAVADAVAIDESGPGRVVVTARLSPRDGRRPG